MFDREQRIRTRAYEIWEREGQPNGRHHEHWAMALKEIVDEDLASGRVMTDALVSEAAPRPAKARRTTAPAANSSAAARSSRKAPVAAWTPADIKPAVKNPPQRRRGIPAGSAE
jgi:hypothetical protein